MLLLYANIYLHNTRLNLAILPFFDGRKGREWESRQFNLYANQAQISGFETIARYL